MQSRTFSRAAIFGAFLLASCLPPASAQVGIILEKFILPLVISAGGELISEGLLRLWDSQFGNPQVRVEELDNRFRHFEELLRQVDKQRADEIATFRASLSEKTSAEDVRRIVQPALASMQARLDALEKDVGVLKQDVKGLDGRATNLEGRAGRLEDRATRIEDDATRLNQKVDNEVARLDVHVVSMDDRLKMVEGIFGQVKHIPPAPRLAVDDADRPLPHPLTAEWIQLLSQSEQSRRLLHELRQMHPEQNPKVQAALEQDEAIVKKCNDLHKRAIHNYCVGLEHRDKLLQEYLPGTPRVVAAEEQLAATAWLIAVTKPIEEGEYQGRMGVPQHLFNFNSSDIINTLCAAKVNIHTSVLPLFLDEIASEADQQAGHYSGNLRQVAPVKVNKITGPANLKELQAKRNELVAYARYKAFKAAEIEDSIVKLLRDYSEAHPQVATQLAAKEAMLAEIKSLNKLTESWLQKGTLEYMSTLRTIRSTSPVMSDFKQFVLLDLVDIDRVSECQDWNSAAARREVWHKFCNYAQREYAPPQGRVVKRLTDYRYLLKVESEAPNDGLLQLANQQRQVLGVGKVKKLTPAELERDNLEKEFTWVTVEFAAKEMEPFPEFVPSAALNLDTKRMSAAEIEFAKRELLRRISEDNVRRDDHERRRDAAEAAHRAEVQASINHLQQSFTPGNVVWFLPNQ
jgi:hypothetical protein